MERIHEIIDQHNINVLNLIFIGFTLIIGLTGSFVFWMEKLLPESVCQAFRYGKLAHKGRNNALINKIEVPKSWFKHFYVFAFVWSMLALFFVLKCLILSTEAPECVLALLDLVAGGRTHRSVQVDSTSALVATVLMTMQCSRRFYETNFVQIFSKKNKMNMSHYLVGLVHYFGAILALLAYTEGFVRGTSPSTFSMVKIGLPQYLSVFIFHFSWMQQYKSNMILVNLRKDAKTGQVATERHLLPKGSYFELVSCPHMLFEILMYISLIAILPRNTTWLLVTLWVLTNQTFVALFTHTWYKENFKNYPKQRHAIIPFVL